MYSSVAKSLDVFTWTRLVPDALNNISKNLRWWLDETGRKQSWVASKLGVTSASVSAWVNGASPPKLEHLAALAHLIGVPMVVLLIEDGLKDPKAALNDLAKKI